MKNKTFILSILALILTSCAKINTSSNHVDSEDEEQTITLEELISDLKAIDSSEIEHVYQKSYFVLGEDVTYQTTKEISNPNDITSFIESCKSFTVKKEKEADPYMYGGTMVNYEIGEVTLHFWNGYLLIPTRNDYYGDLYYSFERLPGFPSSAESYYTFRFEKESCILESSGENVMPVIKDFKFKDSNGTSSSKEVIDRIQFPLGIILIYSDVDFAFNYAEERMYTLQDGYRFDF